MNIKELKKQIENFPDNMEVVISGGDDSYLRTSWFLTDVFKDWPYYYEPEEGQETEEVLVIE